MEKIVFTIAEIILIPMAIISLFMGLYIGALAPVLVCGFYYEDKLIAFEDMLFAKVKGCVKKWMAKH